MLAATKVKVSGSEKNRANRNTNIFCIKRVNRNLKEVSRFSGAKQRQGNVQKKCAASAKLLFCYLGLLLLFFTVLVVLTLSLVLVDFTFLRKL